MRVVLDTNVLIAAHIAQGACSELLEHCVLNHVLVSSEFILGELLGHLSGKFKFSEQEAGEVIALLRSTMEIVVPAQLERAVCRDSDDDVILGTAVAGAAQCIVTGDNDLLVLSRYGDVEIVSPAGFATFERGSG